MASGGARGNAGRPYDPNALNSKGGKADAWIVLSMPDGKVPEWPLFGFLDRESVIWEKLWQKPQASEWKRLGLEDEVALYVRYLVEAEQPEASSAVRTLVKQHQELLGISTAGLNRLHWLMPDSAPVGRAAAPARKNSSSRARLKVVGNGDGSV